MKRITFINTNKAWGGGEKWHFEAALALVNKGYDCSLICAPGSSLEKKCIQNKIKFKTIKTSNLSFLNPLKLLTIYRFLKENKTQSVFLNLPIDAKTCAVISFFSRSKLNIEKIIYRRGMPAPIRNTFLNRFFYSQIDSIIANSMEIKKSVCTFIPFLEAKTNLIYNGVYPLTITPRRMTSSAKIRLGNLGRLVDQKGQMHLIAVAKYLKESEIDFTMKIAGDGPLKNKLLSTIKENQLENHVHLLGHTTAAEFFPTIDLFLFPSHFEGSANAIIESFQYGVPTISFDISSMPEMVIENKTGFLIEPFKEEDMAKKIIEIKKNPPLYEKMVQSCLDFVLTQFNYQNKIKQIEELINNGK